MVLGRNSDCSCGCIMPMNTTDEESGSGYGPRARTTGQHEHVAPRRRDAGYSLTEVLVAVVLMAVAVLPILMAAGVSVRTSAQSRTLARMETVLANAADRVNRAGEGCDYAIYVQAAVLAEGWQPSQFTVTYQYYEPAASAASARHLGARRLRRRRAHRRPRADGDHRHQYSRWQQYPNDPGGEERCLSNCAVVGGFVVSAVPCAAAIVSTRA